MQFNIFKTVSKLLITASLSIVSTAYAKGPGGLSGGGFKYYDTSGKYLTNVREFVGNSIKDTPESELNEISRKYGVEINWNEFSEIILNVQGNSTLNPPSINPDRYVDFQIMGYDTDKRNIIAYQGFFEMFHKEDLSTGEVREIARRLLHEASHLFGIGLNGQDRVSRKFSEEVMSLIGENAYKCSRLIGLSPAQRVLQCDYNRSGVNQKRLSKSIEFTYETAIIERDNSLSLMTGLLYNRLDQWRIDGNLEWKLVQSGTSSSNKNTGGRSVYVFSDVRLGDVFILQDFMVMVSSYSKRNIAVQSIINGKLKKYIEGAVSGNAGKGEFKIFEDSF